MWPITPAKTQLEWNPELARTEGQGLTQVQVSASSRCWGPGMFQQGCSQNALYPISTQHHFAPNSVENVDLNEMNQRWKWGKCKVTYPKTDNFTTNITSIKLDLIRELMHFNHHVNG